MQDEGNKKTDLLQKEQPSSETQNDHNCRGKAKPKTAWQKFFTFLYMVDL